MWRILQKINKSKKTKSLALKLHDFNLRMKPMKKIFLKWFLLISLAFLIFGMGVYIYSPRFVKMHLRGAAITVLRAVASDEPYDNKYKTHPYLLAKVVIIVADAKSKGIDLRVVQGYRSSDFQQKLYNQGRTTSGSIVTYSPAGMSYHNYGWAVDVCEYTNGQINWDSKHWKEIGEIGKKQGLVWGGDWRKFVDKPHMQLSIYDIILHCIL